MHSQWPEKRGVSKVPLNIGHPVNPFLDKLICHFFRLDGHACMLRFLCEAASAPLHSDGLMGHLINGVLLTPKHLIDAILGQQGITLYRVTEHSLELCLIAMEGGSLTDLIGWRV